MAITSFQPPHRVLMGPGPSDIYPQVLSTVTATPPQRSTFSTMR